jgi:PAS domain S-box-containing protein
MAGSNRPKDPESQLRKLKKRLAAAEDTLAAIRDGQVDALMVSNSGSDRLLTLSGVENGYRVFVEAMSEGAVTVGHDGTILYCNRGFADMLGRPLDQLIGTSVHALAAPAHASLLSAILNLSNVTTGRAEIALHDIEGRDVPVFVSVSNSEQHGSRAICMVVTDLREQKRQEAVLATAKLTRMLVEQALEAIAICDSTGKIVLASAAMAKLCSCNPLYQRIEDMLELRAVEEECSSSVMQDMLGGRRFRCMEVIASPRTGGDCYRMLLSAAAVTLPDASGKGFVVTLFDIEERKRAEDALRQSERLAATGRLAATIAHEINNPLEAITNLLFLILSAPNLPPYIAEYARIAQAELERVTHITRQTLAFHRHSPDPEPLRVDELLDSVLFLHSRRAESKGIEITRELDHDGQIIGYASELRQVISNLFSNAVEACPAGGRLRLRAYRSREYNNSRKTGVRIVIADSGNGIPRQNIQRIFEPFYTTKGEKGSGLGLWVSQGIISKHGGYINVRSSTSNERSGTVFSIFLPASAEKHEQSFVRKAG